MRATRATEAPGTSVSSTIRRRSAALRRARFLSLAANAAAIAVEPTASIPASTNTPRMSTSRECLPINHKSTRPLPGAYRAGGESGNHRDDQPAVFRMAAGLYQCPALQGRARPIDRSGSHHRDRLGVVSLSQNATEETQRVILEGGAVPLCFRFALRASLQQNGTLSS